MELGFRSQAWDDGSKPLPMHLSRAKKTVERSEKPVKTASSKMSQQRPAPAAPMPEWNNDTKTPGLFSEMAPPKQRRKRTSQAGARKGASHAPAWAAQEWERRRRKAWRAKKRHEALQAYLAGKSRRPPRGLTVHHPRTRRPPSPMHPTARPSGQAVRRTAPSSSSRVIGRTKQQERRGRPRAPFIPVNTPASAVMPMKTRPKAKAPGSAPQQPSSSSSSVLESVAFNHGLVRFHRPHFQPLRSATIPSGRPASPPPPPARLDLPDELIGAPVALHPSSLAAHTVHWSSASSAVSYSQMSHPAAGREPLQALPPAAAATQPRHVESAARSVSPQTALHRAAQAVQSAEEHELRVMMRLDTLQQQQQQDGWQEAHSSSASPARHTQDEQRVAADTLLRAQEFAALPPQLIGTQADAAGQPVAVFLPASRVEAVCEHAQERAERERWLLRAREASFASLTAGVDEARPASVQGAALGIADRVLQEALQQAVQHAVAEAVEDAAQAVVRQG